MTEQVTRRQRRKILTDKMVMALPRKRKRYTVTDPQQTGLYLRIHPTGPKVFVAVARDPYSKQIWVTLGSADILTIDEARDKAKAAIKRIKAGLPAIEPPPPRPDSFSVVAKNWLLRHVTKKGLRSQPEIERILQKYILPHWGSRAFIDIQRSDVAKLLDHIEDNHGSRMADIALAVIRSASNWFAANNDDFTSRVVRGMKRHQRDPRDRTLKDDEIRAVWAVAKSGGTFGALIQVLLLCGQRRGAVLGMRFDDIDADDGIWDIKSEARAKGTAGMLKLPPLALAIINAQPQFSSNAHVFAGPRGFGPLNTLSKSKAEFDKKCGVTDWVLHDLRRTARSLMSRAGVRPDVGELTLGHTIKGVAGVYDRHPYFDEKADALARLAALVETIVNPPADNVVTLRPAVQP